MWLSLIAIMFSGMYWRWLCWKGRGEGVGGWWVRYISEKKTRGSYRSLWCMVLEALLAHISTNPSILALSIYVSLAQCKANVAMVTWWRGPVTRAANWPGNLHKQASPFCWYVGCFCDRGPSPLLLFSLSSVTATFAPRFVPQTNTPLHPVEDCQERGPAEKAIQRLGLEKKWWIYCAPFFWHKQDMG